MRMPAQESAPSILIPGCSVAHSMLFVCQWTYFWKSIQVRADPDCDACKST